MSYDLMFNRANELYSANCLDEAEQLYRRILEAVPENSDVLNMMGLTAQAKGLHKEAVSYFLQAIKSAPNHIALYFNLAVSYQESKKYVQAIEAYKKVLALNPNIKEAYNNLAAVYEQTGKVQDAVETYQNALKLDENYVDAKVNLAVLNKDIFELEKLSKLYPDSELVFYYLALHYFNEKDFAKALEYVVMADTLYENSADIKLLKAKTNLELKNNKEAITDFYRCLQLNPKCVEALVNLADLEEKEEYYLKALDLEPDNLAAHSNYANLLYKQKRNLEALEEYRKAVILNPDLPELSNNLGLILKDMADYERALDLFMNAFIKDFEQKSYWINIAETLVMLYQKEPEKATSIAQKWLDLEPDNVFAKHILASFNSKLDDVAEAYSKELFDLFSANYDETMETIKYSVLDKIKQLNIRFHGSVLDLGCGTGNFACMFANADTKITGVDVSQNMLDIAKQKNVYQELVHADITDFVKTSSKYDFVLALDIFEYIKNVEQLISDIKADALIFNIETASSEIDTYRLAYNGRIVHNPAYIRQILDKAGYADIKEYEIDLRQENNEPVKGVLFVANMK